MTKKKHSAGTNKPGEGTQISDSSRKAPKSERKKTVSEVKHQAPGKGDAPVQREAVFHPEFLEDLRWWVETDRKTAIRILVLVQDVLRNPFTGKGKPEPLKYLLAGCWSRRISQEHRLVYSVNDQRIDFLQARYHYS